MAQLIKCLIPDFISGHGLAFVGSSPSLDAALILHGACLGFCLSLSLSLSLSVSLPPSLAGYLSLKINKHKLKKKTTKCTLQLSLVYSQSFATITTKISNYLWSS